MRCHHCADVRIVRSIYPDETRLSIMPVRTASFLSCPRIRVLYRVVHNIMILVITRSKSYTLLALALQSAVLRILLFEARQYELSHERVERKYAEVR